MSAKSAQENDGHGKKREGNSLGRLKSFGLTAPWQVALFLPVGWDDLSDPVRYFNMPQEQGAPCAIVGRLSGPPSVKFGNGSPRLIGYLVDPLGNRAGFSAFGDTREMEASLKGATGDIVLFGTADTFNGQLWLRSPEIVPEGWLGRLRPRYSGKPGVINPDTVRQRILGGLKQAIPQAAQFLAEELVPFGTRQELAALGGLPGWTLEAILQQAHTPRSYDYGEKAQQALDYFASLGVIRAAQGKQVRHSEASALPLGDWRKRAQAIPFPLTDEQEQAICDTLRDISTSTPMHRLLVGDVGTGKTAVYGTVCAAVVDGGGTATVLLPNESLAEQVFREFESWWPDLPVQLVTGARTEEYICASLVVGTTALLFRDLGHPDLVVCDEQQKFAREQREQLVGPDSNLLEVSATCIPRSQALARYGVVKVSKLTKCHTKKNIRTRLWQKNEWEGLFNAVKKTIMAGDQVLLVYPLREKNDEEPVEGGQEETPAQKKLELRSAQEMYEKWAKMLPGRVRQIHGQMSTEDKTAALDDMRQGRASVLVATTVVEVGITLPKLRRAVIIHPERHGLTTLHQLRGRLARLGGDGWFDLFLPNPVKEKTMARLAVLEKTTDGFEVAEHDMRLRGIGDLSQNSSKQTGADDTFLFGRPINIDVLDKVMEQLAQKGGAR